MTLIVIEIPEMHFKFIAGYALRNHKIMRYKREDQNILTQFQLIYCGLRHSIY